MKSFFINNVLDSTKLKLSEKSTELCHGQNVFQRYSNYQKLCIVLE